MENTKENVVKLLKARRAGALESQNIYYDRGDSKEVKRYTIIIRELDIVINILTNQEDFDNYWHIWKEKIEEMEQCQKKSS